MIAVILAAGLSSRLRPLTNRTPKSLLPVGGKTLLERTLEAIHDAGVERCIVVTGYHHDKVKGFIRALDPRIDVHFIFNPDFATTNNNYSLWLAKGEVAGQEMLLLDSDILFDPRILKLLSDAPFENALVLRQSGPLGQEEIKVKLDLQGRVASIGKQLDPRSAAGESVGIERFSAGTTELLFEVLDSRKAHNEFYEATFQEMIDKGTNIYAVNSGAHQCIEIDTLEDLMAAEDLCRAGLL